MQFENRAFWRTVSQQLRALIPGVTLDISPRLVDDLSLASCGDFVWAVTCFSANVPRELLEAYRTDRPEVTGDFRLALLWNACEIDDFYAFPKGELSELMKRLNRNIDDAEPGSVEAEVHELIRDRIEHVTLFLVERHARYPEWLEAFRRKQHEPRVARARGHLRLLAPPPPEPPPGTPLHSVRT